jgi:hypothetical protein
VRVVSLLHRVAPGLGMGMGTCRFYAFFRFLLQALFLTGAVHARAVREEVMRYNAKKIRGIAIRQDGEMEVEL